MKEALRTQFRIKRDEFDKKLLLTSDEVIYNKLISLESLKKAKTIMTYVSMGSEVDTHKLINYCLNNGKKVSVPVVVKGTKSLEISYISSMNDLESGSYEILEPTVFKKCNLNDIDLIIVPAIAFDLNRQRIGYGAGYYDRLLSNYKGLKIGICYDFCVVDNIYPGEYDIALDMVITDKRVF